MAGVSEKKKKRRTKDGQLRPDDLPESLRAQYTHMTCGEHVNYHVRPL